MIIHQSEFTTYLFQLYLIINLILLKYVYSSASLLPLTFVPIALFLIDSFQGSSLLYSLCVFVLSPVHIRCHIFHLFFHLNVSLGSSQIFKPRGTIYPHNISPFIYKKTTIISLRTRQIYYFWVGNRICILTNRICSDSVLSQKVYLIQCDSCANNLKLLYWMSIHLMYL